MFPFKIYYIETVVYAKTQSFLQYLFAAESYVKTARHFRAVDVNLFHSVTLLVFV